MITEILVKKNIVSLVVNKVLTTKMVLILNGTGLLVKLILVKQ